MREPKFAPKFVYFWERHNLLRNLEKNIDFKSILGCNPIERGDREEQQDHTIFVTNPTNIFVEKKSCHAEKFSFAGIAIVEKSEISPHV